MNYLERRSIFYQYQFGFRKGHSTAQAIAEIADNLHKSTDNNLYTCGFFLHFSKAFDTVNSILLKKIEQYGIRWIPLQLFTTYITNRQQYTAHGKYCVFKASSYLWHSPGKLAQTSFISDLHQ